jgi:hypothetical protein
VNIIKIIDSENERIESKEEDLDISRLIGDHVNINRDNNINKTSSLLNFTLLNPFNNNYFERY